MNQKEFNKASLDLLLNKIIESDENCLYENIDKFEKELIQYQHEVMQLPTWSLELFLSLIIGFYFVRKVKRKKIIPHPSKYERKNGICIEVPYEINDVKKLIEELNNYFEEKLAFYKVEAQEAGISDLASPALWLRLASNLVIKVEGKDGSELIIPRNLKKIIMLDSFQKENSKKNAIDSFGENNIQKKSQDVGKEANTKLPIKTLNLKQLQQRWPDYSLLNILELANKGYFGIYVRVPRKRRTSYDIVENLEKLVNAKCIEEAERNIYIELGRKFAQFVEENPHLLEKKAGFERLATSMEREIFLNCDATIDCLIEEEKISFEDWNNNFGFIMEDGNYISNSYLLCEYPIPGLRNYSSNYKGYFDENDLIFFVEQIELFESIREHELFNKKIEKFDIDEPDRIEMSQTISQAQSRFIFSRNSSDFYTIRFEGKDCPPAKVSLGLQCIEYLLKNNKSFNCLELYNLINFRAINDDSSAKKENIIELEEQGIFQDVLTEDNPVLDDQTLEAYKSRIELIEEKIEEANEFGDIEKAEKLKREKEFITGELKKNLNNKGKSRNFNSKSENARKSVSKAITSAKEKIKKDAPDFYQHLQTYLTIGRICQYEPPEKIKWD